MFEYGAYGSCQDRQVHLRAPGVDVLAVEFDDFLKVGDIASAADLPHAGDAGLHGEAALVVIAVLVEFAHRRRSRAYEGHVTFEDIPELGEFIEGGLADEFADPGDTGVVLHFEHEAFHFILLHELGLAGFCVTVHGAELVHLEAASVLAHAFLGEDDGAGRIDLDDDTKDDEKNQCHHGTDETAEDVESSFQRVPFHGGLRNADGHCRDVVEVAQGFPALGGVGVLGGAVHDALEVFNGGQIDVDFHAHLHEFVDELGDAGGGAVFGEDEDFVDSIAFDPFQKFVGAVFLFEIADTDDADHPVFLEFVDEALGAGLGGEDSCEGCAGGLIVMMHQVALGPVKGERQQDDVEEHRQAEVVTGSREIVLDEHQDQCPDGGEQDAGAQGSGKAAQRFLQGQRGAARRGEEADDDQLCDDQRQQCVEEEPAVVDRVVDLVGPLIENRIRKKS